MQSTVSSETMAFVRLRKLILVVEAARARVLDALAGELAVGLSPEERAALGAPAPEVSRDMLRSFVEALYA